MGRDIYTEEQGKRAAAHQQHDAGAGIRE